MSYADTNVRIDVEGRRWIAEGAELLPATSDGRHRWRPNPHARTYDVCERCGMDRTRRWGKIRYWPDNKKLCWEIPWHAGLWCRGVR